MTSQQSQPASRKQTANPRVSKGTHRAERQRRSQASPARLAALEACRRVRERKAYAQEVIQATIDRSRLSTEDRAFATLLVLGVTATWGTLDELIDRCLRSPKDVKPDVRDALRISAYELVFLHKEPYAVADQGVELVRAVAPRAAGLGNAALRSMVRAASEFPFGDASRDVSVFARLQGFPLWLAEALCRDMGEQAARELMQASNETAPLFVAENPLCAREGEVSFELSRAKAQVDPVRTSYGHLSGCFRVTPARVLADGRIRHLIDTGKMLVSDASSQMVANLVFSDSQPRSLLEIGAGRGTKTILLEAVSQRRWGSCVPEHVVVDNHAFKLELLQKRARQYGISSLEAVVADATKLSRVLGDRRFEVVFIDAPCSGLGTLRRHPEIRWNVTPRHIEELAATQLEMLRSAAAHVAAGGSLVYATCTVTRLENVEVVKRFLESAEGADFALAPIGGASCFAPSLQSNSPDAHFAVRFQKNS